MAKSKRYQTGGLASTPEPSGLIDPVFKLPEGYKDLGGSMSQQDMAEPAQTPPPMNPVGKPAMPAAFAKGGVALEEGGMLQEGGTVDPVSGNEVPVGSLQEEVRDDIPAKLSEGEFVFPADVVRFIGLERLMKMRQEAKEGLAKMEAMGQMGNSEEAVIEDDAEFETELDEIMNEIENSPAT
jgi:hypothetical protein